MVFVSSMRYMPFALIKEENAGVGGPFAHDQWYAVVVKLPVSGEQIAVAFFDVAETDTVSMLVETSSNPLGSV
jgi:hypothetical protein